MKYLIFVLFVFLIGCSENPVSPVTDNINHPRKITIDLIQYYQCQDSICPPELDLVHIDTTVTSSQYIFSTLDSVIVFGGHKYYCNNFILWYTVESAYVILKNQYNLNHWGYFSVPLLCNTKYTLIYGNH